MGKNEIFVIDVQKKNAEDPKDNYNVVYWIIFLVGKQ